MSLVFLSDDFRLRCRRHYSETISDEKWRLYRTMRLFLCDPKLLRCFNLGERTRSGRVKARLRQTNLSSSIARVRELRSHSCEYLKPRRGNGGTPPAVAVASSTWIVIENAKNSDVLGKGRQWNTPGSTKGCFQIRWTYLHGGKNTDSEVLW